MTELRFDRDFEARPGEMVSVSPLIRRMVANNPSPFTFKGTATFVVGTGQVAVIDPGPDDDAHLAALLDALRALEASDVMTAALGKTVPAYLKLKQGEWNEYAAHLTDWERANTLDC